MNSLKVLIYPSFCPPHPKHLGTSTEYYSLTQKVHYPAHLSQLLSMFIFFSAGLTNPPLLEFDPCKITLSSGCSKTGRLCYSSYKFQLKRTRTHAMCPFCVSSGSASHSHPGTQSGKDSLLIHASMIATVRGKKTHGESCADFSSFHPEVTPFFCPYFLGQSWAYNQI